MKQYHYIVAAGVAVFLFACTNREAPKENGQLSPDMVNNPISASDADVSGKNLPEISFAEKTFDFGKIKQGEKVTHNFKFKNTGKADLIISSASSSCGCTVPQYPKEPLKPGAEGEINVVFNTEGKTGKQHKTITVVVNAIPNTQTVEITAEIAE